MARKLTVLQMLPALEGGGVERGTLEVAAELARRGHRSIVISAGGRLVDPLIAQGSEHLTWSVGKKSLVTLRFIWRLRRFLAENKVDVLHVRSRVPAWIGYLAWRSMPAMCRPTLVTTVHGLYSVNGYSAIMTRGERVIAVSETVRRYILENYPAVDPSAIVVIPRGVDPEEFPYAWQPSPSWLDAWYRQYPQLRGAKVLTLPGRLTRLKGHHDFITLIAALRERGFVVHGLIVGGEDPRRAAYAAELYRRANREGLSDAITFTGHRSDMREIYAVSDVILSLSSKPESFGRTVVEALSLGRVVVGYDHGGVGEQLRRYFPVGCIPVADHALLEKTVANLLSRPIAVPRQPLPTKASMIELTLGIYVDSMPSR